jgi:hypothetical protein
MERPAVADYPPGAQLPWRVLDDYEFVWMLRGQACVTLEDDELSLACDTGSCGTRPAPVATAMSISDPRARALRPSRYRYDR